MPPFSKRWPSQTVFFLFGVVIGFGVFGFLGFFNNIIIILLYYLFIYLGGGGLGRGNPMGEGHIFYFLFYGKLKIQLLILGRPALCAKDGKINVQFFFSHTQLFLQWVFSNCSPTSPNN
jgi:hypothetical protein